MMNLKVTRFLFILYLALALAPPASQGKIDPTCPVGFANIKGHTFSRDGNLAKYTFNWELTKNFDTFREDPDTVMLMPMVKAPRRDVEVITFDEVDPRLLQRFVGEDHVNWPKHPNNTEKRVPYATSPGTEKPLDTRYTASRSLLSYEEDMPAYTVKAGTNYPHKSQNQAAKAFTKDDVDGAISRQPYLNAMTKLLPEDDTVIMLPEVLILRDKKSKNGVLIRDMSKINNENIYVPGLSIPYVGREIAKKNGADFEEFWTEAYAAKTGKSKARLLINYGFEMETPNSQNILVELDKNFKPTGKMVFRDTVDSEMYEPWLDAMGLDGVKAHNIANEYKPKNELNPYATNSIWRFDEAGKNSFSSNGMANLERAHDQAWIKEIRSMLKVDREISTIGEMHNFLSSEEGKKAIRAYHEKLGTLKAVPELNKTPKVNITLLWDFLHSLSTERAIG